MLEETLSLAKEIKKLVARVIKKPPESITLEANLFSDLGVDSLLGVEILAALDKSYHLDIPEEKLQEVTTVKDLVSLVENLKT